MPLPDSETPSPDTAAAARLYDAFRGGFRAHATEQRLADEIKVRFPGVAGQVAMADAFHARSAVWAVTATSAAGVIFGAAGFPPPGSMPHAEAARLNPAALFAYADAGPVVTALLRRKLDGDKRASAYTASIRDPARLLGAAEAQAIGMPVSVHLCMAAHFWPGPFAARLLAQYKEMLARGSSVVLTLGVRGPDEERGAELARLVTPVTGPVYGHTAQDVAGWINGAGLLPVRPGVTDVRGSASLVALRPAVRIVEAVALVP